LYVRERLLFNRNSNDWMDGWMDGLNSMYQELRLAMNYAG